MANTDPNTDPTVVSVVESIDAGDQLYYAAWNFLNQAPEAMMNRSDFRELVKATKAYAELLVRREAMSRQAG